MDYIFIGRDNFPNKLKELYMNMAKIVYEPRFDWLFHKSHYALSFVEIVFSNKIGSHIHILKAVLRPLAMQCNGQIKIAYLKRFFARNTLVQ